MIFIFLVKLYNEHIKFGNKLYMMNIVQNLSLFFSRTTKSVAFCIRPVKKQLIHKR